MKFDNANKPSSELLTVVVNSTDYYADCWDPFFTLFKIYWSDCRYPIILNTEALAYEHEGLDIFCTETQKHAREAPQKPWSDRLLMCLEHVKTPYILYICEDLFLEDYVDEPQLLECLRDMDTNGWSHVRFGMGCEITHPFPTLPNNPKYWVIPQYHPYRVCMQAALWRVSSLRSYVLQGEDAWQFERRASIRAFGRKDSLLCINPELQKRRLQPIYPYYPTGIRKGKWVSTGVVDLFGRHGISVDFERRGFFEETPKAETITALRRLARSQYMFGMSVPYRLRSIWNSVLGSDRYAHVAGVSR